MTRTTPSLAEWRERARQGMRAALEHMHQLREHMCGAGTSFARARSFFRWSYVARDPYLGATDLRVLRRQCDAATAHALTWALWMLARIAAATLSAASHARDVSQWRHLEAVSASLLPPRSMSVVDAPRAARAPGGSRLRMA